MPQHLHVFLILALSLSLVQSCAQLRETVVDDGDDDVTEDPKVPAESEEITGLPAWHNPLEPVQLTGDSLIVSAAAIAADSSDAMAIAELTLAESVTEGLTDILFLLLEEKGVDVLKESTRPEAEVDRREMLIRLYTSANEEPEHIRARSRSISWHSENGQVRCYIRKAYNKAELYEAMRKEIRQSE